MSNITVEGRVAKLFTNPKNWVLVVQNAKGIEGRFSTMKDPGNVEGAQVSFSAVSRNVNGKTYWNIVDGSLNISAAPAVKQSGGDQYDLRQQFIMFQHSQNVAAEALRVALEHEAIKVPKAVADRVPFIVATIGEMAREFYADIFDFVTGDKEEDDVPPEEEEEPPAEDDGPEDPFGG